MTIELKILKMWKKAIEWLDDNPQQNAYLDYVWNDGKHIIQNVVTRDWTPMHNGKTQRFQWYSWGHPETAFDRDVLQLFDTESLTKQRDEERQRADNACDNVAAVAEKLVAAEQKIGRVMGVVEAARMAMYDRVWDGLTMSKEAILVLGAQMDAIDAALAGAEKKE